MAQRVVACVLLLSCACGAPAGSPRPSPEALGGEEEREIVAEAHALELELERLGLVVHEDPALDAYVQSVGDSVAVRARGSRSVRPRFEILYDASANAVALPNGTIFVHTGLLARLENEAQLAHVLAHELSHVFRRHRKDRDGGAWQRFPGAALAGDASITASLGVLGAPVVSRHEPRPAPPPFEHEREADLDALHAMAAAGYRRSEAARLYALLEGRDGAADRRRAPSHPAARERAARIGSAAVDAPEGELLRAEVYRRATREIVVRNVQLCLEQGLYRRALEETARSRRLRGDDPRLDALEAEARRALETRPASG